MSNAGDRISQLLDEFRHSRDVMVTELNKVVIGQKDVIEQILASIFTRGHVLLVGVPGLAKTLMVSSLAKILDVGFKRIQFTPDLMPSDITGLTSSKSPKPDAGASGSSPGRSSPTSFSPTRSTGPLQDPGRAPPGDAEREVTVGQETLSSPTRSL